jgi:hypothetical protein
MLSELIVERANLVGLGGHDGILDGSVSWGGLLTIA